jgi:tRNA threonylcarbamoyl adenosine modification protein YjeE
MAALVESTYSARVLLPSPEATGQLARRIADHLVPGDIILVEGPIGAGKSHFCRAAIRHRLAKEGRDEEVPSPTFTLVQTYELGSMEVWHADLYRLTDPAQTWELGLSEAFEEAVVFIEWPDRLGDSTPRSALRLELSPADDADTRVAILSATDPRWRHLLVSLSPRAGARDDG